MEFHFISVMDLRNVFMPVHIQCVYLCKRCIVTFSIDAIGQAFNCNSPPPFLSEYPWEYSDKDTELLLKYPSVSHPVCAWSITRIPQW